jgi:glycosyltransferase involved in cell wall biosynthesis
MPELVGDRGIVLKENTVPVLSQALEQLLSSAELRERLGRSGRDFAAKFSYEAAARAHKLFFEQLLAGYPNKPSDKN